MTKKIIIFAVIIIIIVGIWLWGVNKDGGLVNPNPTNPTPEPTNNQPVAPKTFQYDSSTDLEAELDSINPEVLDSDFE